MNSTVDFKEIPYYIRARRSAKRRAVIVRRNRFFAKLAIISFIVCIFCIACGFKNMYAGETSPAPDTYKYFTGITVKEGDTLTSIAKEYITNEYRTVDDYIREVMYINHLDCDNINAGKLLIIPYFSTEYK